MSNAYQEDISTTVLRRMKEGGFDFARIHPIEFYAVFPDEGGARAAAGQFRGESLNAQVSERDDGAWHLELSKLMYATHTGIDEFEHDFASVVRPLGGEFEGWGVKQRVRKLNA
ncbi:ribonuclease E inhibitor RraB [Pseudomonas typographi]|uniref:Ribonuclease E inhibitor RraB n=1 Tax=Pseudomonas typographi TaxID=2715964 RepID=A0ABR7YZP4_9PSED|nr:ribonuclease E inhibitor RraB [Pseudomonas typographi]MBD1550603.1 ribonuclease E inhibitor RraB [Pseudomonas typographi]MBD1586812.1 ribonuclease E inhibitor RraB [Pseudomonas typographi]MBD1598706.1 ribonuclease E inhibitor RraB [Pseudomonas typographi]